MNVFLFLHVLLMFVCLTLDVCCVSVFGLCLCLCVCLKCVFSNALCGCVRPDVSPSDWLQLVQSGQHASQPGTPGPLDVEIQGEFGKRGGGVKYDS